MMESLEQARMKAAYAMVEDVKDRYKAPGEKKKWDEYNSRVQSAPVFIHDAGLMQVLAFYMSKKDKHIHLLAHHIMAWLLRGNQWNTGSPVLEKLNDANWNWKNFGVLKDQSMDEQLMNTRKTQSLLKWLKRFSEAQLKEEKP